MNARQTELVQSSWREVAPIGRGRGRAFLQPAVRDGSLAEIDVPRRHGLRALGQRHVGYEAWIAAYTVLANNMKAAAERTAA